MAVVVDRIAGGGGVSIPVSLTTSTGATTTEGILLGTSSVATVGAQKFSPALHFQGSGWKTNATAGAVLCDWKFEIKPVQGAATPVNNFVISGSVDGGSTYNEYVAFDPNVQGLCFAPSGVTSLQSVIPVRMSSNQLNLIASYPITWASSATNSVTGVDTGLSRISAGVVGVGTGAAGSIAGGLSMNNFTLNGYYVHQSPANGAQLTYQSASELLTLSTGGTTTDTSANLLPANAIIDAVVARVTTTITTATSWQLGDPTTAGRFTAANTTMIAGTTDIGTLHFDGTGAAGQRQVAAAKVRVTTVGTPGAGVVRITVFYHTIVPPAS